MSNLGTLIRRELRKLAGREIKVLAGELRGDVVRLKRTVASHERRLRKLDGMVPGGGKVRAPVLVRVRKRLGLSRENMALLMGVHRNTILRLEAKEKTQLQGRIAEALGRVAGLNHAQAIRNLALLKRKRIRGRHR